MALDFLKTMFGGSKTESGPVDMTPPEFAGLRPQLTFALNSMLSGKGPQYSGPMFSPMGGNEQSVLDQLMASTGPQTGRNALLDQTIAGGFLPGQPGGNPFLQAAIEAAQRPTLEGLTRTLTRDLPGRFTQAGQFVQPQGSSAFDTAAATATTGAANAMSDIATNMSFGAHETERTRQQQAIPLQQQEVDTTIKNLQAQALPRMIQELGIERGLALFQQNTQQLLQVLGLMGQMSQPVIANTSSGEAERGIMPALIEGAKGVAKAAAGAPGSSGG